MFLIVVFNVLYLPIIVRSLLLLIVFLENVIKYMYMYTMNFPFTNLLLLS